MLQVIYVEDDEQEAFVMTIGMRRLDIEILHVTNISTETISNLQQPPYHTVAALIFDSILRGQNGLELAVSLRQSGDTRPLFLLTAADNPDPKRLLENNILYIRKPPHFEHLAETIRQHTTDPH